MTRNEAATQYGVSPRMVSHGARVFAEDSPATPELQQAVRQDRVSVSDASQVIEEPAEVQRRALGLVASGEARTVVEGARKARHESPPRPSQDDSELVITAFTGGTHLSTRSKSRICTGPWNPAPWM